MPVPAAATIVAAASRFVPVSAAATATAIVAAASRLVPSATATAAAVIAAASRLVPVPAAAAAVVAAASRLVPVPAAAVTIVAASRLVAVSTSTSTSARLITVVATRFATVIPFRGATFFLLFAPFGCFFALFVLASVFLSLLRSRLYLFLNLLKTAHVGAATSNFAFVLANNTKLVDLLLARDAKSLELLGTARNDSLGEGILLRSHLGETFLFLHGSLPGLAVLLGVLLLQFFVEFLVFDHFFLVRRLDKGNLLLALGALKVIHALRKPHELALHLLPLLDLLLDGIFHKGALVKLLAIFELDLEALLALAQVALLSLGKKSECFFLLLLFHLLADAHRLARAALFFESLRFGLLVQALRGNTSLLEHTLLLLQDALLLFLAAFNDDLARQGHFVLVLNLGKELSSVGPRRQRRGGSFRVHHLHALLELLRHGHEMVLDVITLQLVSFESYALVLVVEANSNSTALGGIYEDALNLGKFQEGNNLLKGLQLHRLVHLRRLLQHAHHSEAAHAGEELIEFDGGDGARGRKLHGLGAEGSEHFLRVLAHV